MISYTNPFYSKHFTGSKPIIETTAKPVEYKGYLIYERISGLQFDIVKDGICVGMCAGLNGAKRRIDSLI